MTRSTDYPEGPSLAERSGCAWPGTKFGGDPYAAREKNRNPNVTRELIENSIVRQRETQKRRAEAHE